MRRTFLLAFAAFFLIGAAWALALPVNGTYDEKHHIVRAYAVADGQFFSPGKASDGSGFGTQGFDVPASLLPGNVDCVTGRGSAACLTAAGRRDSTVRVPSAAARYAPVYYLPVGLPMLASPTPAGIVGGRLVSAALTALLLAAAAAIAVRLRSRLLLAGVVLVGTPMVLNLGGSINPNGLEIAAGVLLFTALSALLRGTVTRSLLVWTGIAAFLLLTVRQLGPVLLAADVVACAALAGRTRVTALLKTGAAGAILGGFTLAGVGFAAGWTLASPADTAPVQGRAFHGDLVGALLTERLPFYLRQVVGQFDAGGHATISPAAIGLWYLLWLAVVVPVLWRGGRRLRLVVAGLAAFCLAMLLALDVYFAPRSGWFAHSRYALPTAVGIVVLTALARRRPPPRWFTTGLVVATVPVHLYALARVMTRFQSGLDGRLDPFGGDWHPAVGSFVPMAVALLGCVVLVTLMITYSDVVTPRVNFPEGLDNGSVTPNGQSASGVTKASTTDATRP